MSFRPIIDRVEYGGALIGQEEEDVILDVIRNQGRRRWTIGENSVKFEEELAEKTGVKYATLVNSGSSALLVATAALKLPKGSKVIIPALNFPTAYSSLLQNNLIPVVIDCDLKTFNLDLEEVKKAIDLHPDVKAVVAVHVAGNIVDLVKLREIVGDRYIISDNCDGYGGTLHGKFLDTYADVSCASFHAAHILCTGEGGVVLTDNEEINTRAHKMREWGRASGSDTITKHEGFPEDYRERYVFEEMGWNMKPLELQCAMGRVQLKRLEDFKVRRAHNFKRLKEVFSRLPKYEVMQEVDGAENCYFSFPFLCTGIERKIVMETLEKNNIEVRTIFSGNILRHPAYANQPHIQIGDLKNSDLVMRSGMFIGTPPSPVMTDEMIDFIEKVLQEL